MKGWTNLISNISSLSTFDINHEPFSTNFSIWETKVVIHSAVNNWKKCALFSHSQWNKYLSSFSSTSLSPFTGLFTIILLTHDVSIKCPNDAKIIFPGCVLSASVAQLYVVHVFKRKDNNDISDLGNYLLLSLDHNPANLHLYLF